jgi:hypothetical protein
MSRSYRAVAAAVVATLMLATTSYAALVKAKPHSLVGTLQKVDGQTITVQTPKGVETVMLVSSSKIHRGAATIQAESLSSYSGQRVKVRYVDSNGQKQAQMVTLSSAPKAAGANKAASAKK